MGVTPALFDAYASLRLNKARQTRGQGDTSTVVSSQGFNGRLCDITQNWLSGNEAGDCFLTGQATTPRDVISKRFNFNSLLLRRNIYPPNGNREPELQLEIQSDTLRSIFSLVAHPLRTVNVYANPIIIKSPYHELYHFHKEVQSAGAALDLPAVEDCLLETELDTLQKFVDENLGSAILEIEALISVRQVSMKYLWAIFKPGDMILLRRQEAGGSFETRCGILQSYFTKKSEEGLRWCVKLRSMSFEKARFGVVEEEFEFPAFDGLVGITSLPIHPLKYCADAEAIKEDLERRGKVFVDLCRNREGNDTPRHMMYRGPVWVQRKKWEKPGCAFFDDPERMICGRVIVDPVGFLNEHALYRHCIIATTLSEELATHRNSRTSSSSNPGIATVDFHNLGVGSLTAEEWMTFPSRVCGYSLVTKDEGYFQVDGFEPIVWEEERAQQIRQSSQRMQTILGIASGFSSISNNFNYGIERKGRGLVILLHGVPGSGKTLTAATGRIECVAEALHLPLYRVSGSDLGTEAWNAEAKLTRAFENSSRWGAIILFDEADAFMAHRKDDSMDRNAMVSVLLRLLEYQAGIVILTSNRKDDFDPAFHSRIHVSVEYCALTANEKEAIWRSEVGKAGWGRGALSNATLARLSRLQMDGRTIKNVVHVLNLCTGAAEKTSVSLHDLKEVLKVGTGNLRGEARKQVMDFCATDD